MSKSRDEKLFRHTVDAGVFGPLEVSAEYDGRGMVNIVFAFDPPVGAVLSCLIPAGRLLPLARAIVGGG